MDVAKLLFLLLFRKGIEVVVAGPPERALGALELADIPPVEDYFSGGAGSHGLEALFEVAPVIAVGYYLVYLESGLEHYGHLVPGLVHLKYFRY